MKPRYLKEIRILGRARKDWKRDGRGLGRDRKGRRRVGKSMEGMRKDGKG